MASAKCTALANTLLLRCFRAKGRAPLAGRTSPAWPAPLAPLGGRGAARAWANRALAGLPSPIHRSACAR
eukprot:5700615-Pyramimonas_sp.AAC.1